MVRNCYERKDSPFVWVQYTDAKKSKREDGLVIERTKIRKDDPEKDLKKARLLNGIESRQLSGTSVIETGWGWVGDFLRARYATRSKTRDIYLIQWGWIRRFLAFNKIGSPGLLTREHCFLYPDWRTAQVKQKSGRSPKINTAIYELKLLGLVMDEAVIRGHASENPARKLGLEREETALKPELSDEQIGIIYNAQKPLWIARSFHVGLHTGLRFGDTAIERQRVQWPTQIVIETPKGGRKKAFAIPIYPTIRDMIGEFLDSGERVLWSLPPKERAMTGLLLRRFFDGLGLYGICFHCTRVTFITRGARAGVPESLMQQMVNHASKEVHRIYQRLSSADALRYHSQIPLPTPGSFATPGNRQEQSSR